MTRVACGALMDNNTLSPGREDMLVLRVKGMTCDHCRMAIERALRKVPGVRSASVDLSAATATVVFEPGRTDRDAAATAIEHEGYLVSS